MDANVQAFRLVQRATNEALTNKAKEQSSRKGGLKGGPARAKAVSPERRAEIARKASVARWSRTTPAA
jgi:hypothetical protein